VCVLWPPKAPFTFSFIIKRKEAPPLKFDLQCLILYYYDPNDYSLPTLRDLGVWIFIDNCLWWRFVNPFDLILSNVIHNDFWIMMLHLYLCDEMDKLSLFWLMMLHWYLCDEMDKLSLGPFAYFKVFDDPIWLQSWMFYFMSLVSFLLRTSWMDDLN